MEITSRLRKDGSRSRTCVPRSNYNNSGRARLVLIVRSARDAIDTRERAVRDTCRIARGAAAGERGVGVVGERV